jgi:hypothetical protein
MDRHVGCCQPADQTMMCPQEEWDKREMAQLKEEIAEQKKTMDGMISKEIYKRDMDAHKAQYQSALVCILCYPRASFDFSCLRVRVVLMTNIIRQAHLAAMRSKNQSATFQMTFVYVFLEPGPTPLQNLTSSDKHTWLQSVPKTRVQHSR